MTSNSPALVRLVLIPTVLSVAALGVGIYGALRPASRPLAADTAGLAELRQELAELRHSVELTRSQLGAPSHAPAIADAERRLARLEAGMRAAAPRARAPGQPGEAADEDVADAADATSSVLSDGTPRFTSLRTPSSAVKVEQLADGALVVTNSDPRLAGQSMLIKGRTADGSESDVSVTVPPPV
ncbi:hypothetical protein [Nannocystis pusilla]|uniref:Secreted protein n=1 Tax=Nannocystis pusilla TaxID=889268 RepID=A0ABS7U098_9BACT|nr:hypothetical protein [Nannocystis pusilla]MBZ5713762.1 hypothetical protein [Nannocystis pusilla]